MLSFDIVVFYNSMNLNCIGALSFFKIAVSAITGGYYCAPIFLIQRI